MFPLVLDEESRWIGIYAIVFLVNLAGLHSIRGQRGLFLIAAMMFIGVSDSAFLTQVSEGRRFLGIPHVNTWATVNNYLALLIAIAGPQFVEIDPKRIVKDYGKLIVFLVFSGEFGLVFLWPYDLHQDSAPRFAVALFFTLSIAAYLFIHKPGTKNGHLFLVNHLLIVGNTLNIRGLPNSTVYNMSKTGVIAYQFSIAFLIILYLLERLYAMQPKPVVKGTAIENGTRPSAPVEEKGSGDLKIEIPKIPTFKAKSAEKPKK